MAVRRDGGFRGRAQAPLAMMVSGKHPLLGTKPQFFRVGWLDSSLTPPHFTNRIHWGNAQFAVWLEVLVEYLRNTPSANCQHRDAWRNL